MAAKGTEGNQFPHLPSDNDPSSLLAFTSSIVFSALLPPTPPLLLLLARRPTSSALAWRSFLPLLPTPSCLFRTFHGPARSGRIGWQRLAESATTWPRRRIRDAAFSGKAQMHEEEVGRDPRETPPPWWMSPRTSTPPPLAAMGRASRLLLP